MTPPLNFRPAVLASLLFAAALLLWRFDRPLYLAAMDHWMIYVDETPFLDTSYLTAQLECWRQGVNVWVTVPCDPMGRTMVYPPIWLRLGFLPAGPGAVVPLSLAMIAGFIAALTVLPRSGGMRGSVILALAIPSPPVAFAVERANVDLLIFALAAVAVLCLERSTRVRLAGYTVIGFAGLLKLYPFAMLVTAARERRLILTALEIATVALIAASVWVWRDEFALMLPAIPHPDYGEPGFGARRLAEALARLAGASPSGPVSPGAIRAAQGVLEILALGAAIMTARAGRFAAASAALTARERLCLIAGSALYCGCFLTGASLMYRAVMLLFVIPAQCRFLGAAVAWPVRASVWATLFLMFDMFPLSEVARGFGLMGDAGWPAPTLAVWLSGELAAWWIFIILGASLIGFLRAPADLNRLSAGA